MVYYTLSFFNRLIKVYLIKQFKESNPLVYLGRIRHLEMVYSLTRCGSRELKSVDKDNA